jgi:hypothetical protein
MKPASDPSLACSPRARMIDENPAHRLSRNAEEVCTVLPLHRSLVDDLEIRLVHKRCRSQRVIPPLAPHI